MKDFRTSRFVSVKILQLIYSSSLSKVIFCLLSTNATILVYSNNFSSSSIFNFKILTKRQDYSKVESLLCEYSMHVRFTL